MSRQRGDKMLDAYFRRQTKQIADASLADVKSKADWEKKRPELRRQFLDMIGLWPLPPRTDLQATVTGKLDAEHFTVEKLHFQSLPGPVRHRQPVRSRRRAQFPAPRSSTSAATATRSSTRFPTAARSPTNTIRPGSPSMATSA